MSGVEHPDPGDLELRWRSLVRPHGDRLSAERVRDWAGGPVLVAIGSTGARHLLVRLGDEPAQLQLPSPVAGLHLNVRRLHPTGDPDSLWVDLSPSDPSGERPFFGLAADIVAELPLAGPPDPAYVFLVLDRWRRFWAGTRGGLSREEQLGLLGELWLMLEWLPRLSLPALNAWVGPLRGRHDFVTPALSIEVKTAGAATGPVVHRITRLDQLDEPGTGELQLLSLRAVSDPLGPDSLDALLERARGAAESSGAACSALLDQRLRAVGVTLQDAGRYAEPLRVVQQELFRVSNGFPRLTSSTFGSGLPAGVSDVTYSLDTSACRPWLITSEPAPGHMGALSL